MSNKNSSRILALIIAPIIGAILGYFLADAAGNGWFSSAWQIIEKPPAHVSSLEAINGDSLWVRSDSGVIYFNEIASICASGCWHEVSKIPKLPILDNALSVTNKACAPVPPLFGVIASISECRSEIWQDQNNTFALLNDGNIYLWEVYLYGEGSVLLLIYGAGFGAIVLFVFVLFFILLVGFFDWVSDRAKKKVGNQ